MGRDFRYLSYHFFKNFIIISFGLTFAAVFIDFIQYINKIEGFNRKVLYFFYNFEDYLFFIYPIALVFGALFTFYTLVLKNQLLALFSFGFNRGNLIKPFLVVSFLVYAIFIALNFTDFAYANNNARAILDNKDRFASMKNLFFKYNNSFVYAKNLDIAQKRFDDVTLYNIKDEKLDSLLHFKSAKFANGKWIAKDVKIKTLKYKDGKPTGYKLSYKDSLEILKGYFPKVIKLLYQGKRMSLDDGYRAYRLLKMQNIDSTKVKSALYSKLVMPLFAPFMIAMIFLFTPVNRRFLSRGRYLLYSVGATLIVWSILYSANMLGLSGAIDPDFGQPLIILVLAIATFYLYFKKA
jgi:lipopolysaccharide export system permease protein